LRRRELTIAKSVLETLGQVDRSSLAALVEAELHRLARSARPASDVSERARVGNGERCLVHGEERGVGHAACERDDGRVAQQTTHGLHGAWRSGSDIGREVV
jgi:hypothetical protein